MKTLTNSQIALLIQEKDNQGDIYSGSIDLCRGFTYYDIDIKKERKDILFTISYARIGNVCKVFLRLESFGWMSYRGLTHSDRKKVEKMIREIQ